jgi:nucleotide-binding universal stress UspA family protein
MTSVTATDPALLDAYAAEPQKRAKIMRATEERTETQLKLFCHDIVHGLIKVRYHVRQGEPLERVLDSIEDFRTDLVVLATHGRTGIKRLVIGSVAEKVVRHAPCPVLTVKPAGHPPVGAA